jgi:hypothetical protein
MARSGAAAASKYWSGEATRKSNALDLESGVFTPADPHEIALSLKRSAERSRRRKGTPYQSAMSMLTFYINRAGKDLPERQKHARTRQDRVAQGLWPRVRKSSESSRWPKTDSAPLPITTRNGERCDERDLLSPDRGEIQGRR